MRLRSGRHALLEEQADEMIRASLEGVTSHEEKSDVLTAWKVRSRYSREVYSSEGVVDPAIRRGMYHRVANPAKPELNSRDGHAPPRSNGASALSTFVQEHGRTDG